MARTSERERGFKYTKRTSEDVRQRANARGGNFDSIYKSKYKVFKVKDGKNLIRILPPSWEGAKHYGFDLWVNYGIGADNQSYLSLKEMKGKKDPLDEARREAQRNGDKDLVKALQPRQRILMWVIDRNDEDEGPQLWAAPFTVDKAIASLSYDEDTKETLFIDDPDTGNDVRFYKEGSGLKTDYPPEKMRILKSTKLSEEKGLAAEWLEFIQDNPLPECVQYYDYAHIAETFDGQARAEPDDDKEEPVTPPTRRAAPTTNGADEDEDDPPLRTRRAVAPPEDDDEPAPRRTRAVVPADEEDDEPPPRRRAAAVAADDDEDDEPPAPVKGGIRERLSKRRSRLEADAED